MMIEKLDFEKIDFDSLVDILEYNNMDCIYSNNKSLEDIFFLEINEEINEVIFFDEMVYNLIEYLIEFVVVVCLYFDFEVEISFEVFFEEFDFEMIDICRKWIDLWEVDLFQIAFVDLELFGFVMVVVPLLGFVMVVVPLLVFVKIVVAFVMFVIVVVVFFEEKFDLKLN
jgi:hypothetical protein